jgi:anaerobic selenocysteine-containing dehydrogenase
VVATDSERTKNIWGSRSPFAAGQPWPERQDMFLIDGVAEHEVDRWVASACTLCSYGCGIHFAVKDERIVGVRGRTDDHVNHGRLGPKGLYGWQSIESPDRLTRPLVRIEGKLEESDWETAMSIIVDRSKQLLAERGASAFGFYTTGQLFLEEYYALAVTARAGIGTAHLDGNTRLCTATAAAALKETFGCDGDPGCYEDVDVCDTLFLVGHNVAETQTVLWARMLDRLVGPDRPKLVVIDPRETEPARHADVHLAIRSGTNVAALNAIQHELIRTGRRSHDRLRPARTHRRRLSRRDRGRDLPGPGRRSPAGRRDHRIRRAARLERVARRVPGEPGDGRGGPAEQHQPVARDGRQGRSDGVPDERPADGAEHA